MLHKLSVPKVIDIGQHLLKVFEILARGLEFFETQCTCICVCEAKLNSCLELMRNILGESFAEVTMMNVVIETGFNVEQSINQLLNHSCVYDMHHFVLGDSLLKILSNSNRRFVWHLILKSLKRSV